MKHSDLLSSCSSLSLYIYIYSILSPLRLTAAVPQGVLDLNRASSSSAFEFSELMSGDDEKLMEDDERDERFVVGSSRAAVIISIPYYWIYTGRYFYCCTTAVV